jgi:hypothetical protein
MATNRIITGITAMRAQLEKRISDGDATRAQADAMHSSLDMSLEEWTMFQGVKSEAHASGMLSHDEAQTVYACLGSSPADFNLLDVVAKATLTKLFQEWRMAKRGTHRGA